MRLIATVLVLKLFILVSLAHGPPNSHLELDRVDVTRFLLSHGRLESVRSEGIAAGLPALGSPVELAPDIAYRNIPGITATSNPADPATVLEVIGGNFLVTLDSDGDGAPDADNLLVAAAAWLPPSFTLLVAEGVTDSDGDVTGI